MYNRYFYLKNFKNFDEFKEYAFGYNSFKFNFDLKAHKNYSIWIEGLYKTYNSKEKKRIETRNLLIEKIIRNNKKAEKKKEVVLGINQHFYNLIVPDYIYYMNCRLSQITISDLKKINTLIGQFNLLNEINKVEDLQNIIYKLSCTDESE